MNVLFGAEMHASAKDIRGKKSSGCEDNSDYKHWRDLDTTKNNLGRD